MRDSLQPRRRWPGAARCLLLALALSACPGGDDAGEKNEPPVAVDTATIQESAQTKVAATCEPPPSPDESLLQNGASWADLEAWLTTNHVTFPSDDPANVARSSVPLCPGCDSVRVELRSTNRTYCMTVSNAAQRRIAGQMTLLQPFNGQGGIDSLPVGARILMFSKGSPQSAQPAILVYNHQTRVKQIPASAFWKFYYCEDVTPGTKPEAQWRRDGNHCPRRQGPKDDFGGPGGGTYGWMACANGCCQFYTPPPADEEMP